MFIETSFKKNTAINDRMVINIVLFAAGCNLEYRRWLDGERYGPKTDTIMDIACEPTVMPATKGAGVAASVIIVVRTRSGPQFSLQEFVHVEVRCPREHAQQHVEHVLMDWAAGDVLDG